MDEAFITNHVLRWARERSGATQAQLAEALRIKPEQLRAWESGQSYPPFGKAQLLAQKLHIPFGYLFLSKPPAEITPIPDLRTLGTNTAHVPSPEFLDLLNEVMVKQLWYHENQSELGEALVAVVGAFKIRDGVQPVAQDIRKQLAIQTQLQHAGSWDGYLRLLVRSAEDLGILVMRSGIVGANTRRKLSIEEFRGFAVSDPLAPLVFINGRDPLVAQIFTFAHEIAHLWVGESAISNVDPTQAPASQRNEVERFCDSVAAEVLVPASEFMERWQGTNELQFQNLARHFRVSIIVVIRRAYELGRINSTQFVKFVAQEKQRQADRAAIPEEESSGGNFYNTLPVRNSAKLTNAVLESLQQGRTSPLEAARLLGIRAATLTTLLEGRRSRLEG